jgi:hypothetical protein
MVSKNVAPGGRPAGPRFPGPAIEGRAGLPIDMHDAIAVFWIYSHGVWTPDVQHYSGCPFMRLVSCGGQPCVRLVSNHLLLSSSGV